MSKSRSRLLSSAFSIFGLFDISVFFSVSNQDSRHATSTGDPLGLGIGLHQLLSPGSLMSILTGRGHAPKIWIGCPPPKFPVVVLILCIMVV